MKKIIGVYRNQNRHWVGDGFPVKNLFSYNTMGQAISPFLMLDYAAPYPFQPTQNKRGVGSHPHRGFETVTIAYQGEVEHRDSAGGGGVINTGDVQWMTAGSGVMHEEFHSEEYARKGGNFEMVQLWVNLPAAHKMTDPKYQAIGKTDIPKVELEDGKGHIRVIAGEYQGHHGPASTFSPINMWDGELKAEKSVVVNIPKGHNTLLAVLTGEVVVNGDQEVKDSAVVVFANDGESQFEIRATSDTKFLVLTGEPLNEPVAGYGPMVMNTREELVQAFEDFQNGKFGAIH